MKKKQEEIKTNKDDFFKLLTCQLQHETQKQILATLRYLKCISFPSFGSFHLFGTFITYLLNNSLKIPRN